VIESAMKRAARARLAIGCMVTVRLCCSWSAAPLAAEPTLQGIMQGLRDDLAAIVDGMLVEDYGRIARASIAIAAHPPIPASQKALIKQDLGPRMQDFAQLDQQVHEQALLINNAADERNLAGVSSAYQSVLNTCFACHIAFRERLGAVLRPPQ